MISLDDLQALIELAQRAPKSKGEVLFLVSLAEKVNAALEAQQAESKPPDGAPPA